MVPPSERPPITARSIPRWPSSPRMSATVRSCEYCAGSAGLSVSPWPRMSQEITPVAVGEGAMLLGPGAARGRVAVGQEHGRPVPLTS